MLGCAGAGRTGSRGMEGPWGCPRCQMNRLVQGEGRVMAKEEVKNSTLEGSLKPSLSGNTVIPNNVSLPV